LAGSRHVRPAKMLPMVPGETSKRRAISGVLKRTATAGAKAAVAMAQCKDIGATTSTDNGAGQIPWVKTPIYLVSQDEMANFVCKHPYWLDINEVYKNVPDKKPTCKSGAASG
jgi:hypothetical protein